MLLVYLGLKLILTITVCRDKNHSIKLKMLVDKVMPVCHCREALKVWQTVLIYVVPFVLAYSLMWALCIWTYGDPSIVLLFFFLSFFFAFDLTAVVYVLAIKIIYKIDYISIDHHIYEITMYKQTYVKAKRKPSNKYLVTGNGKNVENGKFNWKN